MSKFVKIEDCRNIEWSGLYVNADGTWPDERINIALLLDIRAELRALNLKLLGVGPTVHDIERNTRPTKLANVCRHCPGAYRTRRGLAQHKRMAGHR